MDSCYSDLTVQKGKAQNRCHELYPFDEVNHFELYYLVLSVSGGQRWWQTSLMRPGRGEGGGGERKRGRGRGQAGGRGVSVSGGAAWNVGGHARAQTPPSLLCPRAPWAGVRGVLCARTRGVGEGPGSLPHIEEPPAVSPASPALARLRGDGRRASGAG